MEQSKFKVNWGAIYRILNILVIIMIISRWFTRLDIGLYIVLVFAALLIVGLLDSLDNNALQQNKSRHIFDLVLLILFAIMEFSMRS